MNEFNNDRRRLLQLGISASMLASLPLVYASLEEDVSAQLLKFGSEAEMPVNATQTGELNKREFKVLSGLCEFVDKVWELKSLSSSYLSQLQADLTLKTDQIPSYFTEYRHALQLIDLMVQHTGSAEEAWTVLLFADFTVDNFEVTLLGRARRFVFSEMIAHQIPLSGAFKGFGLVNYRGYFGGPFTSPNSYRRESV
jgi:hypothetical protein